MQAIGKKAKQSDKVIVLSTDGEAESVGGNDHTDDNDEIEVCTDCTYAEMIELTTICERAEDQSPVKVKSDDFEILQRIGHGAFAIVYLTRKKDGPDAGQEYAMKKLPIVTVIEHSRTAFHTCTERKVLESIREHPFFVHMHYAIRDDKSLYFVLDYLPGGDLLEYLNFVGGRIPQELTKVWAAELVLALEILHQKKILFRDLKLENILLDKKGHTVLCDFNIAKQLEGPKFVTHEICGTYNYMAPEVIPLSSDRRAGYTFSIDWYALGIVLYEMVTGQSPLNVGDTADFDIIAEILRSPVDYHHLLQETNDFSLVKLERGLLEKNPRFRLTNVEKIKKQEYFNTVVWDNIIRNRHVIHPEFDNKIFERAAAENGQNIAETNSNNNNNNNNNRQKFGELFKGFEYVSSEILDKQKHFDRKNNNNNRKRKGHAEDNSHSASQNRNKRKTENSPQNDQSTARANMLPGVTAEDLQTDSTRNPEPLKNRPKRIPKNRSNSTHEAIEHNSLFVDKEFMCLPDELKLIVDKSKIAEWSPYVTCEFICFLSERDTGTGAYKKLPKSLFSTTINRPRRTNVHYRILNQKKCIKFFQQNSMQFLDEFLQQDGKRKKTIRRSERHINKTRSFRRI